MSQPLLQIALDHTDQKKSATNTDYFQKCTNIIFSN